MNIDDMSKGVTIELDIRYNGKTMNFQSEIAYISGNALLINSIKVNEQTVGFNDHCKINFLYNSDGKLFIWENVNIKLVRYDGYIYHKIDIYGDGKPYNRREAYRLYLGEEMNISINTAEGPSALKVLIKDISETGVGFITKEELDISRTFRLKLKDNNLFISLTGTIIRKEKLDHLDSTLYGGKFIEKNNMLSKFITRRQAEQLKSKSQFFSSSIHRNIIMR